MDSKARDKRLRKLAYSAGASTVILILYCALGAYVFQQLEDGAEQRRKTKAQLNEELVQGVLSVAALPSCASEGVLEPQDNRTCVSVARLQEMVLAYQTETLNKVVDYGLTTDLQPIWTYIRSVFYCWSLATTTGYGEFAPVTISGKVFTMFYSVIGTPLLVLNATKLGSLFTTVLTRIKKSLVHFFSRRAKSKKQRKFEEVELDDDEAIQKKLTRKVSEVINQKRRRPFRSNESLMQAWIAAFVFPIYIGLVGLLVYLFEPLSYFDSYYFTYITFTTMGFGDITPTKELEFMLLSIFWFMGIGVCASLAEFFELKLTDWSKELKTYLLNEFTERD